MFPSTIGIVTGISHQQRGFAKKNWVCLKMWQSSKMATFVVMINHQILVVSTKFAENQQGSMTWIPMESGKKDSRTQFPVEVVVYNPNNQHWTNISYSIFGGSPRRPHELLLPGLHDFDTRLLAPSPERNCWVYGRYLWLVGLWFINWLVTGGHYFVHLVLTSAVSSHSSPMSLPKPWNHGHQAIDSRDPSVQWPTKVMLYKLLQRSQQSSSFPRSWRVNQTTISPDLMTSKNLEWTLTWVWINTY